MIRKLILFLSVFILAACGGPPKSTNDSSTPESSSIPVTQSSPLTGFAKDLQYVKNGQYQYIWVFSRKDGKPLDKDDSAFLRTNAPQVVDWVITEEGKKAIAGTNFNLDEGNMPALKKRFVVEDYSGR